MSQQTEDRVAIRGERAIWKSSEARDGQERVTVIFAYLDDSATRSKVMLDRGIHGVAFRGVERSELTRDSDQSEQRSPAVIDQLTRFGDWYTTTPKVSDPRCRHDVTHDEDGCTKTWVTVDAQVIRCACRMTQAQHDAPWTGDIEHPDHPEHESRSRAAYERRGGYGR